MPIHACRTPGRTLAQLKPGDRAIIRHVCGESSGLYQRLMEIGLLEGAEVQLVRFAPLGDPLQVRLRDSHFSLRKRDAASVQVEIVA
jgi:ferrous iron transport protein A